METREIIELLKRHKEFLQKEFHVSKLGIFGSYARNEADEKSDVDIVVDMPSDFEKFFDLKYYLENLLHRRVDLVKEKNLRLFIKKQIENEILYV